MHTSNSLRWLVVAVSAAMLLALAAACTETVEVPGETVVVEKVVTETVEVPGETVVQEVVKEVMVPGQTVVVEKEVVKEVEVPGETVVVEKVVTETVEVPGETVTVEVVKEVMVPGETIVVEKEVVKEVMVPGQTVVVEKEVVKEVMVPGQTVVVEKEVVKEVMVPGETVVVEKEVVRTIEVPVEIVKTVVKEIPGQVYVTDPTNGKTVVAPQYGGTLTYANRRNPPNADQTVGGLTAGYAVSGVLEKLGIANWAIDRSVNPLNSPFLNVSDYTGALAKSWEMPDQTTIVFNIRQGVNWHEKAPMNGRELTASDVVFSFHRLIGEGSGFTEPPPQKSGITNLDIDSITATDDYTMVVSLNKIQLGALRLFIDEPQVYIYPPEVIKEHGNTVDWKTLVGTGPFELVDWVEADSMTFEKNPNHWAHDEKYPENQLPYVDKVRSLLMPDAATRTAALRAGRVDVLNHSASSQIRSVDEALSLNRTNPELQTSAYYFRANNAYAFQINKPVMDDIRVRRAMQMALDLDTINKTYYENLAIVTPQGLMGNYQTGWAIPFSEWPEEIQGYYTYNPEGAAALLDEAGYPLQSDGVRFKTEMDVGTGNYDEGYAEIAKEYWKQIGIDVEIKVWDTATQFSRFQEGIAVGLTKWLSATPYEPTNALSWVATGKSPYNAVGAEDAAYNALFDRLLDAETIEEAQALSREGDFYIIENHWFIWSPFAPWFNFHQPWIAGFDGDYFLGSWQKNAAFARMWIDQALKTEMGH